MKCLHAFIIQYVSVLAFTVFIVCLSYYGHTVKECGLSDKQCQRPVVLVLLKDLLISLSTNRIWQYNIESFL